MGVFAGRYAGTVDGDFVVFLIGMRINKPWKVHRWLPVVRRHARMIRELERDPDSGFLGATQGLPRRRPCLVQYWRSFEHLERYARDPAAAHLPGLAALQPRRRARPATSGSGTRPTGSARASTRRSTGTCRAIGLGRVGEHAPLGSTSTAALRSKHRAEDEAPVPGY